MNAIARIGLYAAGALAGVYLVNSMRPVQLDPAAAINSAGGGIDTAFDNLVHGRFSAAGNALLGGAKVAGAQAKEQVQGQVRTTVILGVVAGCSVAGLVDAFVL